CSDITLINESGSEIYYPKHMTSGLFTGKEVFRKLSSGVTIYGCALLIPKKAIDNVGLFREDFRFIQDWIYWLELSEKGYDFLIQKDKLVKSRV
ncbi:hypothetical protein, partial [Escherichia coli]